MAEILVLRVILVAGAGLFGFVKTWRELSAAPKRFDHQRIALSSVFGLIASVGAALLLRVLL